MLRKQTATTAMLALQDNVAIKERYGYFMMIWPRMQHADTATLSALATLWPKAAQPSSPAPSGPGPDPGLPAPRLPAPRLFSIWEITTWILPMAAEHLRRVLRQTPSLPQGQPETPGAAAAPTSSGSTRWFTAADVATLRRHFAAVQDRTPGSRKTYAPRRCPGARAPLIALTAPLGRAGRTTATLHLAVAASLSGYRVLVIDADPAGRLAHVLGAVPDPALQGGTLLPLIARACGLHLRRGNTGRLDRGEVPLPMDDTLAAALDTDPASLICPSRWPGLDVIAAHPDLALADLQIAAWTRSLRSWSPARALAQTLDGSTLRARYDLILTDMGAGLGPLSMAILTSADVLLVPLRACPGLASLAHAMALLDTEAAMTARATGQPAPPLHWRWLCLLPDQGNSACPADVLATVTTTLTGVTVLPHPLPDMPHLCQTAAAHLYDLDYRAIGRLPYAPLRDTCDAAWGGLARVLHALWAEDVEAKDPA